MRKFNRFCIIVFITFISFGKLLYLPESIERIDTSVAFKFSDISIDFHETID